jgi:hypothetical protein
VIILVAKGFNGSREGTRGVLTFNKSVWRRKQSAEQGSWSQFPRDDDFIPIDELYEWAEKLSKFEILKSI